jgi:hypothetical protein
MTDLFGQYVTQGNFAALSLLLLTAFCAYLIYINRQTNKSLMLLIDKMEKLLETLIEALLKR